MADSGSWTWASRKAGRSRAARRDAIPGLAEIGGAHVEPMSIAGEGGIRNDCVGFRRFSFAHSENGAPLVSRPDFYLLDPVFGQHGLNRILSRKNVIFEVV